MTKKFEPAIKSKRWKPPAEEELLEQWEKNWVYKFNPDSGKELYSVDTPPPYLSGYAHLGQLIHYTQIDMIARFRSEVPKGLFRVPISITKDVEAWLQDTSNRMKSSGGYKLPRSYIIRALLNAAMELKIDVSGVKTEVELKKRILNAVKRYK